MTVILSHDLGRIADALERIASAQEAMAAADPLAMLSAAMDDPGFPNAGPIPGLPAEPQDPVATNGYTVIYKHPNPESGLEIVARRNETTPGGWRVGVEPK